LSHETDNKKSLDELINIKLSSSGKNQEILADLRVGKSKELKITPKKNPCLLTINIL
jgi:hypothetical protein